MEFGFYGVEEGPRVRVHYEDWQEPKQNKPKKVLNILHMVMLC
ncbi:hypothetical protein MNB_SV-6-493 [hydrothermal vent metagenome]|uniref:Uncharacterized protein n=1 Tax=hydrothermal vent metagenome TaxID=652676 RepID=A0A1W1CA14_9ZZZZ